MHKTHVEDTQQPVGVHFVTHNVGDGRQAQVLMLRSRCRNH